MKNTVRLHSKNYFLGFIHLILAVAFLTGASQAATFTVTNTADSGGGSLRQAILNANASAGADTINFNIAGGGVHTILPQGANPLPEITDSVTINGTTQPGYAGNPVIEIDGSSLDQTKIYSGIIVRNGNVIIKALVIRDFLGRGIIVECSANCASNLPSLVLTGSRIGTNSDGTIAAGNGGGGVKISTNQAATSQIGGTSANEKNVISGNDSNGIEINNNFQDQPPDNSFLIINNMIGTNLAGTAALPNDTGIYIKASRVTIGGDAPAERNVISGNNYYGIIIGSNRNSDDFNIVEGNYIGTNATGTAALGNQRDGINIGPSDNNRIGGVQPGTGNVISGNGWNGITFSPDAYSTPNANVALGPNDTLIYGNKIGTNAAGTVAIGNSFSGISIVGNNNIVGLAGTSTSSNIISGNVWNGVVIHDTRQWYGNYGPHHTKSKGNKIQLNYIGTNSAGADLGNGKSGVLVSGEVTDTLIGGSSVAENTIAFNEGDGVALFKANHNQWYTTIPFDAQIAANKIHSNNLRGINVYGDDAPAGNDPLDADEGVNNLQNAPVLSGAYADTIVGTLHSTPGKTFSLDFYSSPSCDNSGKGEGQNYLNSISVTTDANGNASFETFFGAPAGAVVTATATAPSTLGNASGSTSEFSQCVTSSGQLATKISFNAATYSVNESAGTATITVTRSGGLISAASVNYATVHGGTAVVGQDFTSTSGTLNFNAGQATKTFTIPIVDDTKDEADEIINLALSNPSSNGMLINPSTAVLTITDNDNPPTVSIKNYSAAEGNNGTKPFTFDVTLSEASGLPVSVKWQTSGNYSTATAGIDYTAGTGTLNFAPGETLKQITVQVNGDTDVETNETFRIELYGAVNATFADSQAIGGIHDDDNHGKFGFSAASYDVNESAGGKIIVVHRTEGIGGTVTVDYATTNSGTATANTDFTPVSGTLTFLEGEETKTFIVSTLDDQASEQTETINLVLSNPTGGATLGLSATNINILDDDTASSMSVSGTVTYGITKINQSQKNVVGVVVSATGASNGSDTTDSAGNYLIENLTSGGQYSISTAKSDDVNGITAFDATLVLRHVAANAQGVNALTANQQKAADTDADNLVTAFDATQILRFVAANGPNANTGQTGNWKFLPQVREYPSLGNSLSGENYEAVLIGEVDGDWVPPLPGSEANSDNENNVAGDESELSKTDESTADVEISLPIELSAERGEKTLIVPVLLSNYAGRTISAYNFDLRFDPKILQLDPSLPFETNETLSQGLAIAHNTSKSGRIGIAAASGGDPVSNDNSAGSGILLKLRFKVLRTVGTKTAGETALTFRQAPIFQDNQGGLLKVKRTDGSVRVFADGSSIEPVR
ncbi:MAG: hypothetical protein M3209_05635 [Acidobacteriota bacterium]|nr:hypothetical protein [Acidobacteriota bacterium]